MYVQSPIRLQLDLNQKQQKIHQTVPLSNGINKVDFKISLFWDRNMILIFFTPNFDNEFFIFFIFFIR